MELEKYTQWGNPDIEGHIISDLRLLALNPLV